MKPVMRRIRRADLSLRASAIGVLPGPLGDRLGDLLAHGRRLATKISYDGKQRRFQTFCTETLPTEYHLRPRSFLPASERTVMMYLAHLSREGRVSEQSLQPYLSSINQMHADAGFPKPAHGHYLSLLRKGYADIEAEERGTPNARRVPVPAELMLAILRLGLTTPQLETLRMCACLVLNFCWFNRADTGVRLQRRHVTIDGQLGITINIHGKTIPRNQSWTLLRRYDAASDPDDMVATLLHRWHAASAVFQSKDALYWTLGAEVKLDAPVITKWLTTCANIVDFTPPDGEKWTAHSLRSGGASACQALNVPLFYIMAFGVWKSMDAVQRYLNAFVLPSDAAWLFFGWLRPGFSPSPIHR